MELCLKKKILIFLFIFQTGYCKVNNRITDTTQISVNRDNFTDEDLTTISDNLSNYKYGIGVLHDDPWVTRCCGYKFKGRLINCSLEEVVDLKVTVHNATNVVNVPNNYFTIKEEKKCESIVPLLKGEEWYVQLDGALYTPGFDVNLEFFPPESYCLHVEDNVKNDSNEEVKAFICLTPNVNEVIENKLDYFYFVKKYGKFLFLVLFFAGKMCY